MSWEQAAQDSLGLFPGDLGENTSQSAIVSPHLYVTPNSGSSALGLAAANGAAVASEQSVGQPGPFPTGVETHIVVTFDHDDSSGGLFANGSMTLYRDGLLIGSAAIDPNLQLALLVDNNNWLGRSQWPDPVFGGSFDEFRIYDAALSPGEVAASFAAGPDALVPEPATALLLLAGLGGLGALRSGRAGSGGAAPRERIGRDG